MLTGYLSVDYSSLYIYEFQRITNNAYRVFASSYLSYFHQKFQHRFRFSIVTYTQRGRIALDHPRNPQNTDKLPHLEIKNRKSYKNHFYNFICVNLETRRGALRCDWDRDGEMKIAGGNRGKLWRYVLRFAVNIYSCQNIFYKQMTSFIKRGAARRGEATRPGDNPRQSCLWVGRAR